jgi:DNA segregation ATPase FtsK/SpoIIIE, S-DNA-T family
MPQRANQFRSNTIRDENKPRNAGVKGDKRKTVKTFSENLPVFNLRDGRIAKVAGLFFLILSIFFLTAFTSYLFTWEQDQSYVSKANGGWGNLFSNTQELALKNIDPIVDNWLGKLGALLSNQFIFEWFGIGSFLFVFLFFVAGYRLLFKVRLFALGKTLAYTLFSIVFISVAMGFFHSFMSDTPHFLEGQFGFWTNRLLEIQIGRTGVLGVLVFAGLTVLIIAYNIDFKIPERERKITAPDVAPIIMPEPADILPEEPSTPVEWNRGGRTVKERLAENVTKEEVVKQPPMVQETVFHEPIVLTPDKPETRELPVLDEPEEEDEIPLMVETERPTAMLNIEKSDAEKASSLVEQFGTFDPTLDLASYQYPTLELLENHGSNKIHVDSAELEANKDKIVDTLSNYNIEIEKIKATIGPTVTLYEIIPAPGVRISKIKNLEDDIALSLAALGIRIIAPMPGKGTIGIEVPNQNPEMVSMRSVLATDKFQNTTMDLPIALGKTISNEVFIADLAKMPHLLVAGATGQGKSVGINAILVSLLYKRHPAELKFVLVDPKKVELSLFRKIERHFLAKLPDEEDAIITDTKKVINTLNSLCIEMDQRYDLLKDAQVRNLKEYNVKYINRKIPNPEKHRYLPFIVLVIDEFADLMMTAGKEVEMPIARLAQLARAVGIHLVIATQRPSVNIITGTIKANFPARLAFRVLSKIDSRTILDAGGADQLIGRGDMLLATGSDLIRLQCAFVDTPEVDEISNFIGNQRGYPTAHMLPEYVGDGEDSSGPKDFDPDDRDPMFEDAARLIVLHQQGSTSLIQRKLKLGYNRAGRIIDQLEAAGIVGPFEGSKARDVLYPDEYSLERHLEALSGKGEQS